MKNYILSSGKRIYKRLPEKYQKAALKHVSPILYQKNTAGIVPNEEMVKWAQANPRPVSVVIPSYNDYPLLKACIESVEETCKTTQYEIIVVDDYCQPANSEKLKTLESATVRIIFKNERQGFAKTVNRGMKEAKYDIVLLNSDIVAKPGWLEALQYSAYQVDEKIGMVSPKLVYPDGRIQYGGTYYARVLAPQWFGHLFVGRAATAPVANVPFYNRSISGACVYIKQPVYKKLGGLNETYWLGFEDVDYGLEAWKRDIRCYYQPASMLIHYESASRGYSQGKRELGSMRFFWSRWDALFLRRKTKLEVVDYVISNKIDPLWRQYISEQAECLRGLGVKTKVHQCRSEKDETLIKELSKRESLKICCDYGAVTTTWLSGLELGKLLYLLPGIESAHFSGDAQKQAEIIAKYRPEFDYISPSRYVANQLRNETAWESTARLVPAIAPQKTGSHKQTVVVVGESEEINHAIKAVIQKNNYSLEFMKPGDINTEYLADTAKHPPRAFVVLDKTQQQSLRDLALLALAPIVGYKNDKTQYEILDGYNALLVDNEQAMARSLEDVLTDDAVYESLSENARSTAKHFYQLNQATIKDTLSIIAQNAT